MKESDRANLKEQFFAQLARGASIAEAARLAGVGATAAYRWASRGRKNSVAPKQLVRFARLAATEPEQPLELKLGTATIWVRPGFDAVLLRQVVEALTSAAP